MTWLVAGGYFVLYLAGGRLCHFLMQILAGDPLLLEWEDSVILSQCIVVIPLTILLVLAMLFFYQKKARWPVLSLAGAMLIANALGFYYTHGPLRPFIEYLIGFMGEVNRIGYFSWIAITLFVSLFIILVRQKTAAFTQVQKEVLQQQ